MSSRSVLGRLVLGRSGLAQTGEEAVFALDAWVGVTGEAYGHFTIDYIPFIPYFLTDAAIRRVQTGSTTVSAVILRPDIKTSGVTAARPNADLAVSGTVTPQTGTLRWAMLDEVVLGSDYIDMETVSSYVILGTTPVVLNYEATIQRLGYGSYCSNPAPTGTAQYHIQNPANGDWHTIRQWGQNAAPGPFEDFYAARPWDSQSWSLTDVLNLRVVVQGAHILSNTRWHQAFVNVYWTAPWSFTADAIKHLHTDATFTVSSWFRHEGYSEYTPPIDAVVLATISGSGTLDAHTPPWFKLDATIVASPLGGITPTTVSGTVTPVTSPTWTHAAAPGDRALVVVLHRQLVGVINWVTYGGIPMRVATSFDSGDGTVMWFLDDVHKPRINDIILTSTSSNTVGSSLMLASANEITLAATTVTAPASRNGQTMTHAYSSVTDLARIVVGVATAITTGSLVWEDSFDLGTGMVSQRTVEISTTYDSALLTRDGGVTHGSMSASVAVTTASNVDYLSAFLTSPAGDGQRFFAQALIQVERIGTPRTINAVIKKPTSWEPGFTLEALIEYHSRLDAVIQAEAAAGFTVASRIRTEAEFISSVDADAVIGLTTEAVVTAEAWIAGIFAVEALIGRTRESSFAASAWVASALYYDSRTLAVAVTAPLVGQPMLRISGNMPAFTHDATDPQEVEFYTQTADPPYTAWIKLDVVEAGLYRIDDWVGAATGLTDSIMAIWGPQASPPGVGAEPWHLSDDGDSSSTFDFERSSFSDYGQNDGLPGANNFSQYGTNYNGPVNFGRTDAVGSGITLAVGVYWIEIVPFSGANWVTSQGPAVVNIARMSRPTGTLTVDAVIMPLFRIDAYVSGDPTTFIPDPPPVAEWVTLTTVLGGLPERQPQGDTSLAFTNQSGASGNGVSRVVTRPGLSSGNLLVAFVSGDEENLERAIFSPGWEQYAYFPLDNHAHAGWIFTRRVHAWEPTTYTFYWTGQNIHGGSMAVTIASLRSAAPGMLKTVTDQTTNPVGTHNAALSWGFAGQMVLAAFMGNAFSGSFTAINGLTAHTSQAFSFAQVRAGRSAVFTTATAVQYSAFHSGTSIRINAVLGIAPYPFVPGFTIDASLTSFLIRALIQKVFTQTFTLDASFLVPTILGDPPLTVDYVWVQGRFQPKAVIFRPDQTASFTVNALKLKPDAGYFEPGKTIDAWKAYKRLFILRAWIVRPTQEDDFSLDAVIASGYLKIDAWVASALGKYAHFLVDAIVGHRITLDAYLVPRTSKRGWFTVDALLRVLEFPFTADAWIGPSPTTVVGDAQIDAVIGSTGQVTHTFTGDDGWPVDAVVDSYWSETTFTIDATVTGLEKLGSFSVAAEASAVGEERGAFSIDAAYSRTSQVIFRVWAEIAQGFMRLDAVIAGIFTLDATLAYGVGEGDFTADATVQADIESSAHIDAVFRDQAGLYIGIQLDAVIGGSVEEAFFASAFLLREGSGSFGVDAVLRGSATIDAFIQPYFYANAYISTSELIVWPPSQEGIDGEASGFTFTAPSGDFTPILVGQTIVIGGETFTIVAVPDGQTLTLDDTISGTDLAWYIPSGAATDAIDGPPPVTRRNQIRIVWARPYTDDWHDITGDVMWANTVFTQSARVGAGNFELHLEGAWPDFTGGEEIRVEVDGFVVFGGYTMDVARGYVFPDVDVPTTVLSGVDYNIVLDKLIVYNAEWDESHGGSGAYQNWTPFAKGVSDQTIIRTIARDFMARMPGFDFHTYVDEIESPAPTKKWTMQAGTTLRDVLTEISRITEGVWWIDPYRNLQYHDRSIVTAPFPVTDGDGGVACREFTISSDITIVTNDVIAWGTEAYEEGDASIIYSRQQADAPWSVLHWEDKIERTEGRIEELRDIPYNQRTTKQRADLAALKRTLRVQQQKLADAEAQGGQESIAQYGRWQHAEFRQDIYKQASLDRRTTAILNRYGDPVVKGQATVFDHGYQAGQVALVSSLAHGVTGEMPIREMTIDFPVAKEPDEPKYYAVPRYRLSFGLDPEEPWNVYQYLPFPKDDNDPGPTFNPPAGWWREPGEDEEPAFTVLDDFTREYESETDFGISTSERIEIRPWEDLP